MMKHIQQLKNSTQVGVFYLFSLIFLSITLMSASYAHGNKGKHKDKDYDVGHQFLVSTNFDRNFDDLNAQLLGLPLDVAPRAIMGEVWYPIDKVSGEDPIRYIDYYDYFNNDPDQIQALAAFKRSFANLGVLMEACIDGSAAPAPGQPAYCSDNQGVSQLTNTGIFKNKPIAKGKFPILVYTPGSGGFPLNEGDFFSEVIKAGYIVVAIRITGEAGWTPMTRIPGFSDATKFEPLRNALNGINCDDVPSYLPVCFNADNQEYISDSRFDIAYIGMELGEKEVVQRGLDSIDAIKEVKNMFGKRADDTKIGVLSLSAGGAFATVAGQVIEALGGISHKKVRYANIPGVPAHLPLKRMEQSKPANEFDLVGKSVRFTPKKNRYKVQVVQQGLEDYNNAVALDAGDDGLIPMPFTFTFYGQEYHEVFIDPNGKIILGELPDTLNRYSYYPTAYPYGLLAGYFVHNPNHFQLLGMPSIVAFHNDMNVEAGGAVLAEVTSDDQGERLIVTWDHIPVWGEDPIASASTFQAVLHPDGQIDLNYGDVNADIFSSGYDLITPQIGLVTGNTEDRVNAVNFSKLNHSHRFKGSIIEKFQPELIRELADLISVENINDFSKKGFINSPSMYFTTQEDLNIVSNSSAIVTSFGDVEAQVGLPEFENPGPEHISNLNLVRKGVPKIYLEVPNTDHSDRGSKAPRYKVYTYDRHGAPTEPRQRLFQDSSYLVLDDETYDDIRDFYYTNFLDLVLKCDQSALRNLRKAEFTDITEDGQDLRVIKKSLNNSCKHHGYKRH